MTAIARTSLVKPFSAIPGPKGLPVVGSIFDVIRHGGFSNQIHKYFDMRYKQFGPLYKENFGRYSAVFIHDPVDIEAVFRAEGKYPQRTEFPAWKMHRHDAGQALGVLLSEGPDWQRLRSSLNQPMMNTKTVTGNIHEFLEVAADMLDRIATKRTPTGEFKNLQQELFNWSLESGSTVLFERRLGCLSDPKPAEIQKFIDAMRTVLQHSEKLLFLPPEVARYFKLPVWREFCEAWDTVFRIGGRYVDEKMADVRARQSRGEEVGGLIASQMSNSDVTNKEILSSLIDLMGAAVDTTGNTTMWTLYMLAANPRVQQVLREEVDSVAPPGVQMTPSHLKQLSYLRAVVKETLRMYPAAPILSRVLHDEIIIRNYKIPAGTSVNINLVAIGMEKQLYSDPELYKPERWLRGSEEVIHPFAWLPFGFGVRACIGRRVAEQEIYSMISQVPYPFSEPLQGRIQEGVQRGQAMQKFNLSRVDDGPVDTEMKLLISPKKPLRIYFKSR